jgi:cell division protein FtsZ
VQQACSIIQGAAHDDANIIFGAVMDEKMKDAVKITVIATGFREVRSGRQRTQETHTSFSAAHEEAMEFPDTAREFVPEPPKHIMEAEHSVADDRTYRDDIAPVPLASANEHAVAEVVSLDSMRGGVLTSMPGNFEQDDLDVPAFLRKRNDVM